MTPVQIRKEPAVTK